MSKSHRYNIFAKFAMMRSTKGLIATAMILTCMLAWSAVWFIPFADFSGNGAENSLAWTAAFTPLIAFALWCTFIWTIEDAIY